MSIEVLTENLREAIRADREKAEFGHVTSLPLPVQV
jgi:hypothetical protein